MGRREWKGQRKGWNAVSVGDGPNTRSGSHRAPNTLVGGQEGRNKLSGHHNRPNTLGREHGHSQTLIGGHGRPTIHGRPDVAEAAEVQIPFGEASDDPAPLVEAVTVQPHFLAEAAVLRRICTVHARLDSTNWNRDAAAKTLIILLISLSTESDLPRNATYTVFSQYIHYLHNYHTKNYCTH